MAPAATKGKVAAAVEKVVDKLTPGSSTTKKEKKEDREEMVGRPDQAQYNKEQDAIRAEIEVLQGRLVSSKYCFGVEWRCRGARKRGNCPSRWREGAEGSASSFLVQSRCCTAVVLQREGLYARELASRGVQA